MFLVPKLTRIQLCDTFWFVKIYTPNCLLLNLCLQSPQHLGSTGWQWGIFQSLLRVSCSVVSDSLCPWTVAYQAPLSMGFSRQKYWSGLPFPSPGDLPNPGIKPWSSALQADPLPSEPPRIFHAADYLHPGLSEWIHSRMETQVDLKEPLEPWCFSPWAITRAHHLSWWHGTPAQRGDSSILVETPSYFIKLPDEEKGTCFLNDLIYLQRSQESRPATKVFAYLFKRGMIPEITSRKFKCMDKNGPEHPRSYGIMSE